MIITEGGEFTVTPGDMWTGGNALVGLTVIPSPLNTDPSTRLNDEPAVAFISNAKRPFAAGTPQDQTLIAELNGVFVHIKTLDGRVYVVVADKRLN